MATEPCPRCRSERLSVIYYDAAGAVIGGSTMCTSCGPRHAVRLVPKGKQETPAAPPRRALRKAS